MVDQGTRLPLWLALKRADGIQKYLLRKQVTKPQLYHLEDLDISDEKREADRLARAGGGG